MTTPTQIGAIVRHEFENALGLGHYESDDRELNNQWAEGLVPAPSIMAPIAHQNKNEVQIRQIDIERVVELYGDDGFLGGENKDGLFSKNHLYYVIRHSSIKSAVISHFCCF